MVDLKRLSYNIFFSNLLYFTSIIGESFESLRSKSINSVITATEKKGEKFLQQ